MTKPSSRLRPFPQRHRLFATLLTCCLAAGCQTPGFSTAFSGKDTPAKAASSTDNASPAGLPEPTNTASSNSPLSLSSIEEHLRLGEEELTRGNLQQAQLHFDHVIEKHPDHAKAHHRLGVLADKMNHFEQAEQHYLTALAADPQNAPLLSDLGYSYYMQGRHSDAERYLLQSRKVDPAYDTAIANLGLLYGSTGRKQEALSLFREIGDDEQVRAIMQQIDKGEFGSSGQLADGQPTSQQTSVVTTQTSVQQSSAAGERWAQQDPTGDLAAQLQKARDELRRAEEQLARHQQAQGPSQPQGVIPSYDSHLAQAAWSQQSAQQATAPQAWSQQPSQQPLPQSAQAVEPGVNRAPVGFDAQTASAPLPVVTPGQRQQLSQADATAANGSFADPAAKQFASADAAQHPRAAAGPAGAAAMQGSPAQPSGGPPAAAALSHPVPSHDQFAAGGNTASPPPAAWGRQFEATNQQAAAQNGPNTSSGIQQLNGTTSSFDQRQPVEHALHTQQPQSAHNNIMLTGQDASAATAPLPQIAGQTPAPASSQAYPGDMTGAPQPNSYDIARREAALLGLNAGPGQGFPYIQKYERVRTTPHAQAAAPQPLAAQPHAAQPHAAQVPLASGDPALTNQPWRQAPPQQTSQQPAPVPQPWQQGTANQPGAVPQPSPPGGGQLSQSAAQSPSSAPWTGAPSTTTQYYRADSPSAQTPSQVVPAPYYQQSSARPQGQTVPAAYHATQPAMSYPPQQTSNGVAVPEAYSNRPSAAAPHPAPQYPGQAHPAQNQPAPRPYTGLTIIPGER